MGFIFMDRDTFDLSPNMPDRESTNTPQHSWTSLSEDIIYSDGDEEDAWTIITNRDLDVAQLEQILEKPQHGFKSLCKAFIDLIYVSIEYVSLNFIHI